VLLLFVPFVKLIALRKYRVVQAARRVLGLGRPDHSLQGNYDRPDGAGSYCLPFPPGVLVSRWKFELFDFSYSRLVFIYDWVASMGFSG
jgi:hypothetical protein